MGCHPFTHTSRCHRLYSLPDAHVPLAYPYCYCRSLYDFSDTRSFGSASIIVWNLVSEYDQTLNQDNK